MLSTRLYCQVAPGLVVLNGFAGIPKSAMPLPGAQVMLTLPYAGCGKVNVYVSLPPVMLAAGEPLISKSDAFTPVTGSLKVTAMVVSALTRPAAGLTLATVGGMGSGAVVLSEQSKPRSLLAVPALKT